MAEIKELSRKVNSIGISGSVRFAQEIYDLLAKGKNIISLNVGEPDFFPSENILDATKDAIDSGKLGYSSVLGELELRELIQKKLKDRNNLQVSTDQIVISNGSKNSIYNAFQVLLNDGDEVIIPAPYWGTIPESVKLAGGTPIFVDCHNSLNLDSIKKAVNGNTKAIFINSPNNPSGLVFSKEELIELSKIAIDNSLYVVSDESYEDFVYGESSHVSIASLSKEMFERTISLYSFSKSYAMTGFRLGYMVTSDEIARKTVALQSHLCGNPCTFSQYGAIEALKNRDSFLEQNFAVFNERRNHAYNLFSHLFKLDKPQGAFYLYPDVTDLLKKHGFKNSDELASFILQKTGVAVLSGTIFGSENRIRICYATSEELLEEAFERMREVL